MALTVVAWIHGCSRTDLTGSPTSDATSPGPSDSRDAGRATVPFKVAFLSNADYLTPFWVWHSSTKATEKLPWQYSGYYSFTYNGRFIVALDLTDTAQYGSCAANVLDSHANLLRRQGFPAPWKNLQCGADTTVADPAADHVTVYGGGRDPNDGGQVAFLGTLSADGGYRETDGLRLAGVRYAPDGRTLVYFNYPERMLETIEDDAPDATPSKLVPAIGGGSFSFDQRSVAFISCKNYPFDCGIGIVDVATHAVHVVSLPETGRIFSPQFTPDGESLVYTRETIKTAHPATYSVERVFIDSERVETLFQVAGLYPYGPPNVTVAEDQE